MSSAYWTGFCFFATVAIALAGYSKRHFLYCFFLLAFACYELLGPFLLLVQRVAQIDFLQALVPHQLEEQLSGPFEQAAGNLILLASLFVVSFAVSYAAAWRIVSPPSAGLTTFDYSGAIRFTFPRGGEAAALLLVVFLAGLISMYNGDGAKLGADYYLAVQDVQELAERTAGTPISRALGLGVNLLPYAYTALIVGALYRRPSWVFASAVAMAPMIYELLQAGRRQYFVTATAITLLALYYLVSVRRRALILIGCLAAILALSSYVFYGRADYYSDVYASQGWLSYLAVPALSEFMGVSLITSNALNILTSHQFDSGARLVSGLLDSLVPYAHLGTVATSLMAGVLRPFDSILIAPWGAFPVLAESYASFGILGSVLFGIICGLVCALLHYALVSFQFKRVPLHITFWIMTVASLFLMKYRSGLLDFARSVIALTYLHLFIVSLFWGLRLLVRSAVVGTPARGRRSGQMQL